MSDAESQALADPMLTQDAGSDDEDEDDDSSVGDEVESVDAVEERFHALEEEVATLVADVHDLALYTKLNITGFMKILKVRSYRLYARCIANLTYSVIRNTMYGLFSPSCPLLTLAKPLSRNKPLPR